MDISDAVTTDHVEFEPDTTLSELRGAFNERAETRAVVVTDGESFEGVVTQRQLLASRHSPDEKTKTVMRSAPRVSRTEDVRETARLMVENELKLLPVFEGTAFHGVVTARDLLALVEPHLDAVTVGDIYSRDLVTAEPETTLGEIIHRIRNFGITRIPIVDEDDDAVGVVSVYDLVDFTVREMERESGGSVDGFDAHGGGGTSTDYDTHGGYGERVGEAARMLDLPARDVMNSPAHTVDPDRPMDEAVGEMLEYGHSSLVVTDGAGEPTGIVTKTDALRALTVEEETHMPVQIFGVDMLDVLSREEVAEHIETIEGKYDEMDVLEATVAFQQHDERLRGTPLVRATIRLFTDKDIYSGTAEEYGADAAFDQASETLERNVLDGKGREQTERMSEDDRERSQRLLGWWLEP